MDQFNDHIIAGRLQSIYATPQPKLYAGLEKERKSRCIRCYYVLLIWPDVYANNFFDMSDHSSTIVTYNYLGSTSNTIYIRHCY